MRSPLLRPLTVLMAAAMASPALYQGFVSGTLDATSAMIRFLIAVPVAMLMLAAIRAVTTPYRRAAAKAKQATLDSDEATRTAETETAT